MHLCVCFVVVLSELVSLSLQATFSATDPVPVAKEGCKVGGGLLVMHVVSWSTPKHPKGHQVVQREGQVITNVVLHGQPDTEHGEYPCGERVNLKQEWVQVAPEAHGHELRGTEVLCGPREGGVEVMVDGMHPPVQVGVLMVQHMPDEVLGVKDEQSAQTTTEKFPDSWRSSWQHRGCHDELIDKD